MTTNEQPTLFEPETKPTKKRGISDVGRSWRTPYKHGIMNKLMGREIGAANNIAAIHNMWLLDLSAGDGSVPEGLDWHKNCSPGLLAHHAKAARKPTHIDLFEIDLATFDRLIDRLDNELPKLGYVRCSDTRWTYGDFVVLEVHHGSGFDVDITWIKKSTAVLASNDPNTMRSWAMRPSFCAEVACRTQWFTSISTMGCNVGGLMRIDLPERTGWFDLLEGQELALPNYRDLLLAKIVRDDAKWGYLLCQPTKWRERVVEGIKKEFEKSERFVDVAWFRIDRTRYEDIKGQLFLTKKERGA